MKENHRIILNLLSGRLNEMPAAVDWKGVFEFAQAQGVAAVVWDSIYKLLQKGTWSERADAEREKSGNVNRELEAQKGDSEGSAPKVDMPKDLQLQWLGLAVQYEQRYAHYEQAIGRLAKFYDSEGIKMMVLKGYGLSLYYPVPKHRPCGDIDIWQFGRQKEADDAIHAKKGIRIDNSHHHHTVFYVGTFMVENHYDFGNVHAHLSSAKLEPLMKALGMDESRSTVISFGDGGNSHARIYLPAPQLNALFLLRHAASHWAAAEITLRHLLDWAYFVQAESENIDWEWLYSTAQEYNMDKFLAVKNAICVDFLGFDKAKFPVLAGNAGEKFESCEDAGSFKSIEERVFNDILSPEFNEPAPEGLLKTLFWKYRRWHSNSWKHRLVYPESLFVTFFVQLYCHILKPKSFR